MSLGIVLDVAHATVGAYAAFRTLKESAVMEDAERPSEEGYDVVGARGESPGPAAREATARWLQFWTMYGLATVCSTLYTGSRGNVLAVPILAYFLHSDSGQAVEGKEQDERQGPRRSAAADAAWAKVEPALAKVEEKVDLGIQRVGRYVNSYLLSVLRHAQGRALGHGGALRHAGEDELEALERHLEKSVAAVKQEKRRRRTESLRQAAIDTASRVSNFVAGAIGLGGGGSSSGKGERRRDEIISSGPGDYLDYDDDDDNDDEEEEDDDEEDGTFGLAWSDVVDIVTRANALGALTSTQLT